MENTFHSGSVISFHFTKEMAFAAYFLLYKSYVIASKILSCPCIWMETLNMTPFEELKPDEGDHPIESFIVEVEKPITKGLPGPNTYAAKKSVAQGMMDIALITANANQLRYLLEYSRDSPTFYLNVVLIVISLILQVAVGISLIFKGRFDLGGEAKHAFANRLNNYVVVGVFMVTIINVFVAAFSISGPTVRNHHEFSQPVADRDIPKVESTEH